MQRILNIIGFHSRPWDKELLQGKYCDKKSLSQRGIVTLVGLYRHKLRSKTWTCGR